MPPLAGLESLLAKGEIRGAMKWIPPGPIEPVASMAPRLGRTCTLPTRVLDS